MDGETTTKGRGRGRTMLALLLLGASLVALPPGAAAQGEPEASGPDPEVINGVDAAAGAFPFQVAILNRAVADTFQAQFCGGSLIGHRRVLTAAHCVVNNGTVRAPATIDVLVGTNLLNGTGRRIAVTQIHVHPRYNGTTLNNDLATLDLAQRANTGNVRTVAYARPNQASLAQGGSPVTVVGWGQTNQFTPPVYTSVLKRADIQTWPRSECNLFYPAANRPAYVHGTQICAGFAGVGACHGDSGGPLLRRSGNRWIQVGIVSHGEPAAGNGCATAPEVYSRVSAFSLGNDHLASALPIPAAGGRRTAKTFVATKQVGEPNHAGNIGGASAWFRWRAPRTGFVTISTNGSNFDTLLGVYRGTAIGRLTRVARNDDVSVGTLTSRVRFRAVRNVTYRIAVDGYRGAFGSASVRVQLG